MISTAIIVGFLVAFFLAWNNGSNNAANMVGTAVGAEVLSLRRALAIAAVASFIGSILLGRYVAHTIMGGIIDIGAVGSDSAITAAMISVLLSASIWTLISSFLRIPMSVHACVLGALIGAGMELGAQLVRWGTLLWIFVSWIFIPFATAGLAYAMLYAVREAVHDERRVKILVPALSFAAVFVPIALSLIKSVSGECASMAVAVASAAGGGAAAISTLLWRKAVERGRNPLDSATRILLINAVVSMSFAFGSCSVANAAGPLAAIVYRVTGSSPGASLSMAVTVAGASLALGIATWGSSVVETVGRRITLLSPTSAFVAQLSAALVMAVVSRLGIPASTSMAIVGGVMGVGLCRGVRSVDFRTIARIFGMWYAAIPCAAATAYAIYLPLSSLL